MARTPKNQILKNIIAQPNEYVYVNSGLPFSGYYHIISGRAFAGGDENVYPQQVPLEKPQNNALNRIISSVGLGTAAYNLASRNKETARNLAPITLNPHIVQTDVPQNFPEFDIKTAPNFKSGVNYYFQKSNDPNHIIKKISYEEAYHLVKDPINKVVSIDFSAENVNEQLINAEKIIPGITIFANL
jgi:hypothetical protein